MTSADAPQANRVQELRLVMTVRDFERNRAFYEQLLGTPQQGAWASPQGQVVILEAGRATLEIVDQAQAERIDQIEVGRRVSGELRLALGFADSAQAAERAQRAGGALTNPVTRTPWNSHNARVLSPEGLQLTLFSEAVSGAAPSSTAEGDGRPAATDSSL